MVGAPLPITVRQAISDGRSVSALAAADGPLDGRGVMPVHGSRMPAIRREAHDLVVGDGERGGAVDRDAVVVEQHDQAAEAQVSGQGRRFVADAFHQAAIAGDHIGVVVDEPVAEAGGEVALGQRHADRVGQPLAERPGRGLDPERMTVFGMARRAGAELPEAAQLVQGHVRIAGEIEQRVEQHRAVPGREHEPVAVGPIRMLRVVLQEPRPQHSGDVRHAHGHARVTGLRLLDRIHGQRADGVGEVVVADRHGNANVSESSGDSGVEVGAKLDERPEIATPIHPRARGCG